MVAEQSDGLAEDVYLLKPNNSDDKSVELAVTHLSPLNVPAAILRNRPVLILLHGQYQNRNAFWRGAEQSVSRQLVSAGIDVWLMEMRGHGLSAVNTDFDTDTLADTARYDIPAVTRFVAEMTGERPVHWLGKGIGGGALLMSQGAGALLDLPVASLIGSGDPFGCAGWSRLPGLTSLVAGRKCRDELAGPEMESCALIKNLIVESRKLSRRGAAMGIDLWYQLRKASVPLAWISVDKTRDWSERGLRNLLQQGNLSVLDVTGESLDAVMSGRSGGGDPLRSLPALLDGWMNQDYGQEMGDGISAAGEVAPFA
ncbi:hypothetical protein [Pseudomaricurvus sp. HS19]|uniref:hypothetical protein n=1 Tax=Pseudomaricurvus sp. HS19 TaxID=2692626 RepID=UPI00136C5FB7|nr:hypothetical protein [Pseudomaricurvus sp. HS19]MYM62200.1 hypothetical protein [Pseudomaricurvus sp. HS19]